MEEIKVMEKPDWVSWDDIHELLLAAHKKNIEKGMTMRVPQLPPEELKGKLGDNGRCFVALANGKLIGTTSVRFFKGHSWYDKDMLVAHSMLSAILPKYQGIGIAEEMNLLRDEYIHKVGATIIHADTPENNTIVRKNAKRNGFVDVAYYAPRSDHYSVVFVKWLNGCPFTDEYINRRFRIAKFLTKMQYKPGKVERNRLLTKFGNLIKRLLSIS